MRLWLTKLICPPTHRLIEVGDVVTDPRNAANDLINGGDALARGWDCDPAILYNAASILRDRSIFVHSNLFDAMQANEASEQKGTET